MLEAMVENGGMSQPHIIMDPFQQATFHNGALRVLREAGADRFVEYHAEPSEIFLPKLIEQGRQFDFAFIDGDHRFDGAFIDVVFVHKLLKPGGVMAVDDTELDAVHLACRFAETNWGYTYVGGHNDRADKGPGRHRYRNSRPRAQLSAYRKPMEEAERNKLHFTSFVHDFSPYIRHDRLASNKLGHEGLVALSNGDREAARCAFREAVRVDPTHIKNLLRYVRTYLPLGLARAFTGRSKQPSKAAGDSRRKPGRNETPRDEDEDACDGNQRNRSCLHIGKELRGLCCVLSAPAAVPGADADRA
jgi:hypothetical protein